MEETFAKYINVNGELMDLSRPQVMGILNVTPDSFYADSRKQAEEDIDCKEGDKAIIFGDDLPVTVLSDILETIPYEILTSVSNRVKRVYYQD